jgi:hypothetical protein
MQMVRCNDTHGRRCSIDCVSTGIGNDQFPIRVWAEAGKLKAAV